MTHVPTVDRAMLRRGQRLVWSAFTLLLVPAFIVVAMAADLWPDFLPTILLSQILLAVVLVMCYRGDPWARWILVALMTLGALRAGVEFGGDYPAWIVGAQIVYSVAIIVLLQAPATRRFLHERRSRVRHFAR